MTIEQEAREAAEKAAFESHDAPTWDDPVARDAAIRWHMRGFEAGAQWEATRPVTDTEVGAAWEAYIAAQERDPYDREGRMRAALEAAREETK